MSEDHENEEREEEVYRNVPEASLKQKLSIGILIGIMYVVMIILVYLLAIHVIAVAPV